MDFIARSCNIKQGRSVSGLAMPCISMDVMHSKPMDGRSCSRRLQVSILAARKLQTMDAGLWQITLEDQNVRLQNMLQDWSNQQQEMLKDLRDSMQKALDLK